MYLAAQNKNLAEKKAEKEAKASPAPAAAAESELMEAEEVIAEEGEEEPVEDDKDVD